MSHYAEDRAWSDGFEDQIKRIIGPLILVSAPIERDRKEAADFIVFLAKDMTIAARLRRPGYAERYPNEFTIRSFRPSGAKTELSKIVDGWGDRMFFGHVVKGGGGIAPWHFIDLHALRACFIRRPDILHKPDDLVEGFVRSGERTNPDGTRFRWFDITRLPSEVLLAKWMPQNNDKAAT